MLETQDGEFYFFKSDILKGMITYSSDKHVAANLVEIPARRAFEVINMNRRGEKPEKLAEDGQVEDKRPVDLLEQDNINRFDRAKKKKKKGGKGSASQAKGSQPSKQEGKPENKPAPKQEGNRQPAKSDKPQGEHPNAANDGGEGNGQRQGGGNRQKKRNHNKPKNPNRSQEKTQERGE